MTFQYQVCSHHNNVTCAPSLYSVTRNLILSNHLAILCLNFLIYKIRSLDLTFLRFLLVRSFLTLNYIIIILLRTAKSWLKRSINKWPFFLHTVYLLLVKSLVLYFSMVLIMSSNFYSKCSCGQRHKKLHWWKHYLGSLQWQ